MPDTRDVRVQFYANRLLWGLAGIAGKVTLTKRTFEHTPSRLFAGLRPGLFPEFRTVSVTLEEIADLRDYDCFGLFKLLGLGIVKCFAIETVVGRVYRFQATRGNAEKVMEWFHTSRRSAGGTG